MIGLEGHPFTDYLQQQGYFEGNNKFRHFCYSSLRIGNSVFRKEKLLLEVISDTLFLDVSFAVDEAAEQFIIGLFHDQPAFFGDRDNGLELMVNGVERLPEQECSEKMTYNAWSPVVISLRKGNARYATYLSPEDPEYAGLLFKNLHQKWQTLPGTPPLPESYKRDFRLLTTPKSRMVAVNSFTSRESRIRGFIFRFQLKAPVDFHRLILSSGLGEKNAAGFGWVEPFTER